MPDLDLVAIKDFSYQTRRLKAGDHFTASHRDGHILIGIRKAALEREPVNIPPPPSEVVAKAVETTPAKAAPRKRTTRKRTAKK